MMRLTKELARHPVIAAVRNLEAAEIASKSSVAAIFILGGSILTLPEIVKRAHDGGKYAFVHIDLADGLGRDEAAVEWCADVLRADGLISTRPQLLRKASESGMVTIQRLFLMDSSSFEHGKRLLRNTPPDMAEETSSSDWGKAACQISGTSSLRPVSANCKSSGRAVGSSHPTAIQSASASSRGSMASGRGDQMAVRSDPLNEVSVRNTIGQYTAFVLYCMGNSMKKQVPLCHCLLFLESLWIG